jgi:hypothetical protein
MSYPGPDDNPTAPAAGEPASSYPPATPPTYPSYSAPMPPSSPEPSTTPSFFPATPATPFTPAAPSTQAGSQEPAATPQPAVPVPSPPPPASYTAGSASVPSAMPGYPSPYAAPYPGYAQQFSAPPVSAPYGYAMPTAVPEPKRGRAGIIIVSVLAALFLVTTGIFTTLFITRTSQANDLSGKVTQLSADNGALTTKSNNLQRDLDSTKKDLEDSTAKNDETTRQRTVLADCLNAIIDENKAIQASKGVETSDVKAKEAVTNQKCDAASRLL